MQIIIDVDEKDKRYIDRVVDNSFLNKPSVDAILNAVRNGTPLPKGHGKIVDIDKIDEDRVDIYLTVSGEYIEAVSLDYLDSLQTIIEADKEEE